MFGAIYVGLSGLNAYSQGLQQVSNNVANMNTLGFKGSSVTFSDTVGGGTNGGISLDGTTSNGGDGVEMAPLQRDFSEGNLQQTQNALDLAIDGTGFFVLTQGDQTYYTRTGSFQVDKDGYVVLAGTDYRLATLDSSGRAVEVSVNNYSTNPPQQTTTIQFANNLSSSATTYSIGDVKVYDAQGTAHDWSIQFAKDTSSTAGPDDWIVTVTDSNGTQIGQQTIKFNNGVIDPTTSKLTFADSASGLSVVFDFSQNVTSYSSGDTSTLNAASVDGHGLGTISSVEVNDKGELEISYSNDQKKSLGAVAIADFRDPQALDVRSGGLYVDNGSAGRELFSTASNEAGKVVSHQLEASNVDLAKQFGDMIIIQRGYQASSQLTSVANEMMQQLLAMGQQK